MEDITWTHLTEVLNRYGQAFVELAKENLSEDGSNASFTLSNSLRYIFEHENTSFSVSIGLEEYWKFVENGRGPGKFPPIDKIREWIEIKPVIPQAYNGKLPTVNQLAFLIARKIALEGTEGTNFFSRTQESINEQFLQDIEDAISMDIDKEIDKILFILK